MAPALTQETQPELLLPYLSTPPYTPSPPSALITPALSAATTTCSNMEHGPSGAHQHKDTKTSLEITNKILRDKFDNSPSPVLLLPESCSRPPSINQPTPPHSTDSSAPLSPLDKSASTIIPKLETFERKSKGCHDSPETDSISPEKKERGGGILAPSPQQTEVPHTTGVAAAIPSSTMGFCSVNSRFDNVPGVGDQCSAPQPNDTPPPLSTLLPQPTSHINSSVGFNFKTSSGTTTAMPVGDLFNGGDILPPALAEELISFVSMDPSILEQLGATVSNSVQAQPTVAPQPQQQAVTPDQQVDGLVSSLSVRQLRLQKRGSQLLRRVRRLTDRALGSTVSSQLRTLLAEAPKLMNAKKGSIQTRSNCSNGDNPLPPIHYDPAALKSMSTANLVNYVRRMERSEGAVEDTLLPALPPTVRQELSAVGGEMRAAARLHQHHDSDATESSSGGESCDEMEMGYDDDLHRNNSKPM